MDIIAVRIKKNKPPPPTATRIPLPIIRPINNIKIDTTPIADAIFINISILNIYN